MSKHDKYMIVGWYWASAGDSPDYFETEYDFVTGKQLEDITKLMKRHNIKRWVKNPETVTSDNFKVGDASLIEFRNVTIEPVKIVDSWSMTSEIGL